MRATINHSVPGVTLLSDAAHLMVANGKGANLTMLDGAETGQAIAAKPNNIEAALAVYKQAMFARFARSAVEAAETHAIIDLCPKKRAPYGLIEFFTGGGGRQNSYS